MYVLAFQFITAGTRLVADLLDPYPKPTVGQKSILHVHIRVLGVHEGAAVRGEMLYKAPRSRTLNINKDIKIDPLNKT